MDDLSIPVSKLEQLRELHSKAWDAWEDDEDNKYKLGYARGIGAILAELEEEQPIVFSMGADGWGINNE
jgi:hypothetical protein